MFLTTCLILSPNPANPKWEGIVKAQKHEAEGMSLQQSEAQKPLLFAQWAQTIIAMLIREVGTVTKKALKEYPQQLYQHPMPSLFKTF